MKLRPSIRSSEDTDVHHIFSLVGDRLKSGPHRFAVATAIALAGGSCAAPPPPPPEPVLDARRIANVAQATSRIEGAAQIAFDWEARELGAGRFDGRGVARLQEPEQARLDLFGSGDQGTIAQAALVGGELRMPDHVPDDLIPPPRMLWGVLGVVRPGTGAGFLGGETLPDGRVRLSYRYMNGEEIHYMLRGARLDEIELLQNGQLARSVELTLDEESKYPARARYRDFTASTELTLIRDRIDRVESVFSPDIFDFRGRRTGR